MTRPGWGTRLVGRPHVCLSLMAFYGLLVLAWTQGGVRWWVGLLAIGGALRAYSSYKELKNYNAWAERFDSMLESGSVGRPPASGGAPASGKDVNLSRYLLVASVMVAVGMPLCLPSATWTHSEALLPAWLLACGFISVRAVRSMSKRNRMQQSKAVPTKAPKAAAKSQDFVVAWALPRPPASPSWQAALAQTPDYCRALLSPAAPKSTIMPGRIASR